ncbi:MAG: hypothetical protein HYR96_01485 [Deltaproteobacteria bacterium]|nr:hypothetical protein [Deltaproteobacteria bacterium]
MPSSRIPVLLLPLGVFTFACALRLFGGSHLWSLTFDSVFYAQATQRVATGEIAAAIGSLWMPLISWFAALPTVLGFSPTQAILLVNMMSALGTIALLFHHIKRTSSVTTATAVALLLAVDPLVVQQATTLGADTLYLFIATLVVMRNLEKGSPSLLDAFLLPLLILCRLPGLIAALYILSRWLPWIAARPKTRIATTFPTLLTILILSLYFRSRIGVLAPSPSFALNHFYLGLEWLHQAPDRWCHLYDGHHTVLGDLNQLEGPLPPDPALPQALVFKFRWLTLGRYLFGWLKAVSPPVLAVAGIGLLRCRREKGISTLFSWAVITTMGMVLSTYVPRYYLPALPFYYVCLGRALDSPTASFRKGVVALCAVGNIAILATTLAMGHLKSPRPLTSAGEELYRRHGPNHRVATTENFVSAVQARGRWKYLPCVGATDLVRYLQEQKIEFVIVPIPRTLEGGFPKLLEKGFLRNEGLFEREMIFRVQGALAPMH